MITGNNFGNPIFEKTNIDCDVLAQSLQSGTFKEKSLQKAHKILSESKSIKKGISRLYPLRAVEIEDFIYVIYAFSYGEKEIPEEILYELVKAVNKTDLPSIQFNGKSPGDVLYTKLGVYPETDFQGLFEDNINAALYNSDEQIVIHVVCAPKSKKSCIEASVAAWAVSRKNDMITEVCSQFITDEVINNINNLPQKTSADETSFINVFKNIFNP